MSSKDQIPLNPIGEPEGDTKANVAGVASGVFTAPAGETPAPLSSHKASAKSESGFALLEDIDSSDKAKRHLIENGAKLNRGIVFIEDFD